MTLPNRAFALAGTSQGHLDDHSKIFTCPSTFGRLSNKGIDWAIFGYNRDPLTRLDYPDTQNADESHFGHFRDFQHHRRSTGSLPRGSRRCRSATRRAITRRGAGGGAGIGSRNQQLHPRPLRRLEIAPRATAPAPRRDPRSSDGDTAHEAPATQALKAKAPRFGRLARLIEDGGFTTVSGGFDETHFVQQGVEGGVAIGGGSLGHGGPPRRTTARPPPAARPVGAAAPPCSAA
jgi:hypothetical protein